MFPKPIFNVESSYFLQAESSPVQSHIRMRLQEAHTLLIAGVSAWLVKGQNWGLICLFVFFFLCLLLFFVLVGRGREGGGERHGRLV